MTDATIDWLLEGPAWVAYRTRVDLLGEAENAPVVKAARGAMLAAPQVQGLMAELQDWPGPALKRHNDAAHLIHKLTFAADLGLRVTDPGIDRVVQRAFEHQSPEGPFQVMINIPVRFGGSGDVEQAWMLCDAPLITYTLAKMGLQADQRVRRSVDYLLNLVRDNGWPCAAAPRLGRFRGPGRKADPCPYATLIMLKLLAQFPDYKESEAAHLGIAALLDLWEQRKARRPYLFAMGTHFARLKVPLIWYDILHMLDVLTAFPWARQDPRVQALARIVQAKADEQGRFTSESIWTAWKEWEFGQKRTPSRWLTLTAQKALRRM